MSKATYAIAEGQNDATFAIASRHLILRNRFGLVKDVHYRLELSVEVEGIIIGFG